MPRTTLVLLLLVAACGSAPTTASAPPAPADPVIADPATAFSALEGRLLAAKNVEILTRLRSEGAVTTEFVGHLRISQGRLVHLDFKGKREGEDAEALLLSDGEGMNGRPAPPALNEGLLVGLTRMGLLHNVYVISAGRDPDGTDGNVRQWVTVGAFRQGPVETVNRIRAASIEFTITVSGAQVAEATLFLHPETGLPLLRRQVVHFPQGDMRVVEAYGTFRVDGP